MSIIMSMNLISVHFWTYLKRCVSSLVVFSIYFSPPQKHGLQHNWDITFHFGLYRGVGGRTYVRTDGRSHDHGITKISCIDGLPHFLTNGAEGACGALLYFFFYEREIKGHYYANSSKTRIQIVQQPIRSNMKPQTNYHYCFGLVFSHMIGFLLETQ